MRSRRQLNLAISALCSVVILVGCGQAPRTDVVNVASERPAPRSSVANVAAAADAAVMFSRWLAGVQTAAIFQFAEATADAAVPAPAPAASVASAAINTLGNCGGDLPPCYVKQRESGGDYGAVNPAGCGGYSCGGAWQFDPRTWNDYGGYHYAQDAPPEVQDARARELYAGGAGASHWGM